MAKFRNGWLAYYLAMAWAAIFLFLLFISGGLALYIMLYKLFY